MNARPHNFKADERGDCVWCGEGPVGHYAILDHPIAAGRPPIGRYPTAEPIAADLQNALQMLSLAKREPDEKMRAMHLEGAEDRVRRAVEKLRENGVLL